MQLFKAIGTMVANRVHKERAHNDNHRVDATLVLMMIVTIISCITLIMRIECS